MIVTDPGLGADVIGVLPLKLVKHTDANTMTTRSRRAWIGTDQLSIDSKPHAAVPSFTDQLQDAGCSRAHANEVHDARDAAAGHYAITWIPCSPAGSTSENLAYTITPSADWTPGDGMLDTNQLYNFSLPMTVASTPHNNLRDMSGMDIRDVRLVQVIHGGLTNWLLRPFAHGRFVTWEGFRTRTEALLWSTCSKLLRRSQSINLLTLEKDLANSLELNLDDFNQRIKVHDHLANLVLQFLQQHHATLTPSTQTDDMVKKYNDLNRAHKLLQAQYSASLRASTSPTVPNQKDDAELVTPPPTNHTQSSSPPSSLPTASAAALDGKSFDGAVQPRILQSLHGLSSPPSKPAASQLLTMHSTLDDVIKYYTWTSDQPRLYLKQSPTTTTLASLIKRANHPSRLNGNKSLDSMAMQLLQARQRMPKGDAPMLGAMAALWGLEPGYLTKLTDKALCHLIVTARLLSG